MRTSSRLPPRVFFSFPPFFSLSHLYAIPEVDRLVRQDIQRAQILRNLVVNVGAYQCVNSLLCPVLSKMLSYRYGVDGAG